MRFGDRIKQLRNSLRLTQSEISRKLNIDQGKYSRIERGISEFSMSQLHSIQNLYNVNLNWLLTGKGEMFLDKQNKPLSEDTKSISDMEQRIAELERENKELNNELKESLKEIVNLQRKLINK